jgi:hypothetical protein
MDSAHRAHDRADERRRCTMAQKTLVTPNLYELSSDDTKFTYATTSIGGTPQQMWVAPGTGLASRRSPSTRPASSRSPAGGLPAARDLRGREARRGGLVVES